MKVVINNKFGGFGLSPTACELLGIESYVHDYGPPVGEQTFYNDHDIDRSDPRLVEIVEKMGAEANGPHAKLEVVDVKEKYWEIEEYDGAEHIIASDSPIKHY